MLTIEEVRTYMFLFGFIVTCFVIIAYAWRNPSGALKLLCIIAIVALGIAGFAMAEDTDFDEVTTINFRQVEPVIFNGEALLCVYFDYHGKLLSWYDTIFLPQTEYHIIIFGGEEVIDAEPLLDAITR